LPSYIGRVLFPRRKFFRTLLGTISNGGATYSYGYRHDQVPLPTLPAGPNEHFRLTPKRTPECRNFRKLPWGSSNYAAPICPNRKDPHTIQQGFRKRIDGETLPFNRKRLRAFRQFVRRFIRKYLTPRQPLSFEEWLASTGYDDKRKEELRAAYNENKGTFPERKYAQKVKSHPKLESYEMYKFLRWINSRGDRFKVWSGPLFKTIEHELYQLHYFIKKVPVTERAQCIRGLKRASARYIQTDYTSFEKHFTADVMRACEFELYKYMLGPYISRSELSYLLGILSGVNKLSTRSGCKGQTRARRMSGEMCTSLGNGFTNLMITLFLAEEKGLEVDGFVEGDDGLFAIYNGILTTADYNGLGFDIKIIEGDDPCTMSFCGLIFGEDDQIIRSPAKFVQNFGWTSSFIHAGPKIMAELLRAKALSSVYETPHCPIIGAMARRALLKTRGVCPRFVHDGYHDFSRIPRDESKLPEFCPTFGTRLLFEQKFGVPVHLQLDCEAAIQRDDIDFVASVVGHHKDVIDSAIRFVGD